MIYVCLKDGGNLDLLLDVGGIRKQTSPEQIRSSSDGSMWRYLPLLPVGDPGYPNSALRAVGWTPLLKAARLGVELGLGGLWLKDDGRNPTASFKDRASAVVVVRAREIGAETVVTASTGNAGAALAGMAAAAGLPAVILAPRTAPKAKIAQLLIFGARVLLVEGSYDEAFDLTLEAAEAFGWYCRNTGYNPFTVEGKKTAAFEICEQLTPVRSNGPWAAPDAVFVSVGDGNILSGLHKGFKDLHELGWIKRLPRLYGVQSSGSAAVANAFRAGSSTIEPVKANTLADSIAVDLPRDGIRALRAARETGGAVFTVEDGAILSAIQALGREAVFAEPAGAASYAGVVKAVSDGLIGSEDQIVAVITGSGLKDVSAALRAAGSPLVIEPTLKALKAALG
ncbi:MAG: threonine synthase [Anaerolineales bacterium]